MRETLKQLFSHTGYRLINRRQRWGVDVIDDLSRLKPNKKWKIIFDVGANIGQSARLFTKAFPKATVYSFEPFPESFKILATEAPHLKGKVIPVNTALSDSPGNVTMRVFKDGAKNTIVKDLEDSMREDEDLIVVSTETLDNVCVNEGVLSIDLLKIDVEGSEMKVLSGARRMLDEHRIQYIYAEFHVFVKNSDDEAQIKGHTALCDLALFMRGRQMRPLSIYTDSVHQHEPIGTYNVLFGPNSAE